MKIQLQEESTLKICKQHRLNHLACVFASLFAVFPTARFFPRALVYFADYHVPDSKNFSRE